MITIHQVSLHALTVRVGACDKGVHQSHDVTTLKADLDGLIRDVYELKSTYIVLLYGTFDFLEGPSTEVPVISKIPPTTALGDDVLPNNEMSRTPLRWIRRSLGSISLHPIMILRI